MVKKASLISSVLIIDEFDHRPDVCPLSSSIEYRSHLQFVEYQISIASPLPALQVVGTKTTVHIQLVVIKAF